MSGPPIKRAPGLVTSHESDRYRVDESSPSTTNLVGIAAVVLLDSQRSEYEFPSLTESLDVQSETPRTRVTGEAGPRVSVLVDGRAVTPEFGGLGHVLDEEPRSSERESAALTIKTPGLTERVENERPVVRAEGERSG
jgi:hypothetical protein